MKRQRLNEKGIALVLILWVLVLLSVIAGEFCFAMRTEVNITRNFKDQSEAYYLALAGVNRAIGELIRNERIRQKSTPLNEKGKAAVVKEGTEETEQTEEDEDPWRINVDVAPVSFGGGEFRVRIGNESGKININGANEALLKMMVEAFDIEQQQKDIIVDSILDWRDENDLHRLNGAENEYYNGLPEPYPCKNGSFDSVEELLLVRGVTPEIYYGWLKDVVSALTPPKDNEKVVGGFKEYRVDLNKININAASGKVLMALPSMTEDLVRDIMTYRKGSDFRVMSEVCSVVGTEVCKAISPYITLEMGPFFKVKSEGTVGSEKTRRGLEVVVEVDRRLKKGYRIVEWRDRLEPGAESFPKPEQ